MHPLAAQSSTHSSSVRASPLARAAGSEARGWDARPLQAPPTHSPPCAGLTPCSQLDPCTWAALSAMHVVGVLGPTRATLVSGETAWQCERPRMCRMLAQELRNGESCAWGRLKAICWQLVLRIPGKRTLR